MISMAPTSVLSWPFTTLFHEGKGLSKSVSEKGLNRIILWNIFVCVFVQLLLLIKLTHGVHTLLKIGQKASKAYGFANRKTYMHIRETWKFHQENYFDIFINKS